MYDLRVYEGGRLKTRVDKPNAGSAFDEITELLGAHPGCEKVEVWMNLQMLFAVDRHGNRLSD